MKKVIILTGNTNYNQQRYLKDVSSHAKDDEYADILPETRVLHPRLQYEYANNELRRASEYIIVTFSDAIINSLIFKMMEGEIRLNVFYNGHEVMFDDMGYFIESEYTEGFMDSGKNFIEKLSLLRLRKLGQ